MLDLVGIQRCLDEETWILYPPEVIRQACTDVCGGDAMLDCWGEDGPESGDFNECTSCYCHIVWTEPQPEMTYLERPVAVPA